jgi:hypothetical protein
MNETTNRETGMNIERIMTILGATDGQNGASWDPEVLRNAAKSCMAGESAYEFQGRPTDAAEMQRFADAWSVVATGK